MAQNTFPYEANIETARLLLDVENPRIPQQPSNQRDAIVSMARNQENKLLALAKHIVENGLNPADRLIVIPDGPDDFIVLDGNRRLTALKVLETPEMVLDSLKGSAARQLKKLADTYKQAPIDRLPCIVLRDREEADTWIELLHDDKSGGAGPVKWSAQQKRRYQSRRGAKPYHLQVSRFCNAARLSESRNAAEDRSGKVSSQHVRTVA